MQKKNPWLSKTMWLGLITSVASVVSIFHPPIKEVIAENQGMIGAGVGLLVMILRVVTTGPLSIGKK